jgi:hypothetical protein
MEDISMSHAPKRQLIVAKGNDTIETLLKAHEKAETAWYNEWQRKQLSLCKKHLGSKVGAVKKTRIES